MNNRKTVTARVQLSQHSFKIGNGKAVLIFLPTDGKTQYELVVDAESISKLRRFLESCESPK